MARRLIISTNSKLATKESRDTITRLLEGKGWSIWHWFEDLWLVANVPEEQSLSALRDEIVTTLPDEQILIMSTEGILDHAGVVNTNAIPWIDLNWKRRPIR